MPVLGTPAPGGALGLGPLGRARAAIEGYLENGGNPDALAATRAAFGPGSPATD
jgi:hypothetical protein